MRGSGHYHCPFNLIPHLLALGWVRETVCVSVCVCMCVCVEKRSLKNDTVCVCVCVHALG